MRVSFIHPVCNFLTAFLLICLVVPASNAEEARPDNVITVIATRQIQGKNIASAKQEAIEAALATAVDQGALIIFSAEALTREFKPYSSVIAGNAEKFIDNYKILGESSSGGYYRVMLQATVSFDQLKASLTEFQLAAASGDGSAEMGDHPRLLFLLSEQGIKDISPKFWWGENAASAAAYAETAMAGKAEEAGVFVIAHGNSTPDVPVKAAIVFQPELSNRDASDIGRRMGADVVIVGKAIVYAISDTGAGGTPAYNATITVRAVQSENGQEIFSGFETAVRQAPNDIEGSREALTAAGIQAANNLIPSIALAWENVIHPTENITLTVVGTGNLGNFVRFRQELRNIDGVRDLQVQQMNANEAIIAVRFEGNAQDLGKRLGSNPYKLFSIDIRNISNDGLDIALVPK